MVVFVPIILAPLPDVAEHVVKTKGIGGHLADYLRPISGVVTVPGKPLELLFIITEGESRLSTGSRCVLPFRLGQQAIGLVYGAVMHIRSV